LSVHLGKTPEELREYFYSLHSRHDIGKLLDITYHQLIVYLYRRHPSANYTQFSIPKKGGGVRAISAPSSPLALIQKKLNQVLQAVYTPKPSAHGFIPAKSIVTNARAHLNKRWVFNVDLEDFFPSINFGRVRGLFMGKPYNRNPEVATTLAQLCCYDNQLPQGAPTSPAISNMICAQMDSQLQGLARANYSNYTRYADDLTFSTTSSNFASPIAYMVDTGTAKQVFVGKDLQRIIEGNGFRINNGKVYLQSRYERQNVTGLTANVFPNIKRSFVKQVRAMLHAWKKHGLVAAEHEFLEKYDGKERYAPSTDYSFPRKEGGFYKKVVKGKIDFMGMVRGRTDPLFLAYLKRYAELDEDFQFTLPSPAKEVVKSVKNVVEDSLWVLEALTDKTCVQGTAFKLEGYGFVTCEHVLKDSTMAFKPDNPDAKFPITMIKKNPDLDLAIFQIAEDPSNESAALEVGDIELGYGVEVRILGFPNYQNYGSHSMVFARVSGFRHVASIRRCHIDKPIVRGTSGGPVLDENNKCIGVVVTGADREEDMPYIENAFIPIATLNRLPKK